MSEQIKLWFIFSFTCSAQVYTYKQFWLAVFQHCVHSAPEIYIYCDSWLVAELIE